MIDINRTIQHRDNNVMMTSHCFLHDTMLHYFLSKTLADSIYA